MGFVGYKNFGFVPNEAFGQGAEDDEESPRIRGRHVHMTLEGIPGAEQEKVFRSGMDDADWEAASADQRRASRVLPINKLAAAKKLLQILGLPDTLAMGYVVGSYLNGGMDAVINYFIYRKYGGSSGLIIEATLIFAEKMRIYNPRISERVKGHLIAIAKKEPKQSFVESKFLSADTNARLAKEAKKDVGPATQLLNLFS